jgi:hypothetical protein
MRKYSLSEVKNYLPVIFPASWNLKKELHCLLQVKDTYSWKKWRIREHFRRSQYLPEPFVAPAQNPLNIFLVILSQISMCSVLDVHPKKNSSSTL